MADVVYGGTQRLAHQGARYSIEQWPQRSVLEQRADAGERASWIGHRAVTAGAEWEDAARQGARNPNSRPEP